MLQPAAQIIRALGFLSRLPLPDAAFKGHEDETAAANAGSYPLAGIVIAIPAAIIVVFAQIAGLNSAICAALALAVITITTGALHEDGLADCADGLWGAGNKQRALEIMKDSRIGTYGTLALIMGFAIKWGSLTAILEIHGVWAAAGALITVGATSRAAMVWYWASLPNARPGGISASAGTVPETAVTKAIISGLLIHFVLGIASTGFVAMGIALFLCIGAIAGWTWLTDQKLGGQTGDTIGASQQLSEIALLIGLAMTFSAPI